MAGGFAVTISVVDKATASIAKINSSFATLTKPLTQAQTALAKLGKDTGLDKLTKSLGSVGSAAVSAVEKMGALNGSAGALAGVGSAGGLALLTRQWAEMGIQATNASYRIGIGTGELVRFQAAARLAGISGDAAAQGFETMAQNIGDVLSGRSPQMAGYFAQLGIKARYAADGTADVSEAFRGLKKALDTAPTAQGKNAILAALGLPADLRRVIENVDDLSRSAAEFRPNAGAAAEVGRELGISLSRLGENMSGIADNAERILGPGLKKIIGWLGNVAEWANRATASLGPLAHLGIVGLGAAGGAATGALGGAAIGMLGGPVGALGGAVIGGGIGAVTALGVDALGHPPSQGPLETEGPLGAIPPTFGIKRNNPGNLRVPGGIGFQNFETPGAGLVAAAKNLVRFQTVYGVNTIEGIAKRWAPPNENDTGRYARNLSEETGFLPNEPLDLRDPRTSAAILSGIVKNEQGRQPFTPEQMAAAVAAGMAQANASTAGRGEVSVTVNAPPGTTATADASRNWPTRVQYALPTGARTP